MGYWILLLLGRGLLAVLAIMVFIIGACFWLLAILCEWAWEGIRWAWHKFNPEVMDG